MCGLAGYLSPTAFPEAVLVRMTTRLGHRGPDAEGYYRDGPVALGHRRLSVLDIEGSPQPMSTPDGRLTCIFNGEIYNFAALRGELAARGHVFRTQGDTEVLLYAYREYGTRMLDHLQGMLTDGTNGHAECPTTRAYILAAKLIATAKNASAHAGEAVWTHKALVAHKKLRNKLNRRLLHPKSEKAFKHFFQAFAKVTANYAAGFRLNQNNHVKEAA